MINQKRLLLFYFFSLVTIGASAQRLTWSATRKLKWSDFKGKVADTVSFAGTAAGIDYTPIKRNLLTLKAKYTASAVFDSNTSFYLPERSTDNLLEHEQLHFDIAAIFATRLQQLFDKAGSISDRDAAKIFKGVNEEFKAYEQLYDDETNHGTNTAEQSKWSKLIYDQLPVF